MEFVAVKQEVKQEDDSNQVEITVDDIAGVDNENLQNNDEYILDMKCDKSFLRKSINNNDNEWANFEDSNLSESDISIKLEIKEEKEEEDDDYFIEENIKIEHDAPDYLKQEESKLFGLQHDYDIKEEDIEFEDHQLKSESEARNTMKKESSKNEMSPKYKCKFCDYKCQSAYYMKIHLILHEDPSQLLKYRCTECTYKTRQKAHLTRHFNIIHENPENVQVFTCAICSYDFRQKSTLKRHIESVHTKICSRKTHIPESGAFKCEECSYTTHKKGLLMSHLDKHKDTRDVSSLYICDICSFSTKYRRNLRKHFETHKESQELQAYECTICKFKTRMGYCLKRHLLSKRHLERVGKLEEYCPRSMKMKQEAIASDC